MKKPIAVHYGTRVKPSRVAPRDSSRHSFCRVTFWTTGNCGLWRLEVGYSLSMSQHSLFIYRKTYVARSKETPMAAGMQLLAFGMVTTDISKDVS